MASYLPPTENLPIFDSSVFDDSNSAYLTYTSAKKLFLTYPTAQGEETIASLISAEIDTATPTTNFNFLQSQTTGDILIGNSLTASGGATIRVGPTGATGNVSVHCANIDFYNNTINNATDALLNNLSIGGSQTSGVLNIGTGTRVTGLNGGAINIGTGASVTAPINIGGGSSTSGSINIGGGASASGSINIGQIGSTTGTTTTNINTSTVGSHPVNIGSSTALTTINGASTLTGLATATTGLKTTVISSDGIMGITSATAMTIGATSGALSISSGSTIGINCTNTSALSLGTSGTASVGIGSSSITTTVNGTLAILKPLTLQSAWTAPINTQLGYTSSVTNPTAITLTSSTLTNFLGTGTVLPLGVCLMSFVVTATFTPASSASSMTMSFNESSGTTLTSLTADTSLIMVGNSTKTTFTFTSIMVNTNAIGGEITWQVTPSAITTQVSVIIGDAKIAWVKIA
jgi:hypothetical protein